jgi:hypothetical protein
MSHCIDFFHIQGVGEAEKLFIRRKENTRYEVREEEIKWGKKRTRKGNEEKGGR